ncbi:signal peptidase I [Brucella lupini]
MQFTKAFIAGLAGAISSLLTCNTATAELMNLRVSSTSMMPVFGPGDVVAATSYRPQEKIERGDLVVYTVDYVSKELSGDVPVKAEFLGRVIGLPGESVKIENGIPLINGKALETTKITSTIDDGCPEETVSNSYYQCRFVRETIPEGKRYVLLNTVDHGFIDNVKEKALARGQYYIMGDNRDNANDSRGKYVGLVSKDRIKGKIRMVSASVRKPDRQWRLEGFPGLE